MARDVAAATAESTDAPLILVRRGVVAVVVVVAVSAEVAEVVFELAEVAASAVAVVTAVAEVPGPAPGAVISTAQTLAGVLVARMVVALAAVIT